MRGYILTKIGLEKIENFISVENKLSRKQISQETCLDRATVTKALQGEKPVNLRTIRRLFLSLGIPLEKTDYYKVSSTGRPMSKNKEDYEMLIGAAEDLEQQAAKEHDEARKQELLDRAQQLRARAADLPDDDE